MVGADLLVKNTIEIDTLVFCRSPDSISTVLEGETVILDMESGVYSGLNEVGTVMWTLLENQTTFAELQQTILTEFDVTLEECSKNLISFLKELELNKLIEVRIETNT